MADLVSQYAQRVNQRTYYHLKLALNLNLRRQLFIAICDDLQLRDRLARQLQADLVPRLQSFQPSSSVSPAREQSSRSRLVTLTLDLDNPDPIGQITGWLQQANIKSSMSAKLLPRFQVLGVEHLTRRSPTVQRRFLSALRRMETVLPDLDVSWLLWLSRPWAYTLQQSAPEFWRWRTGLFEFVGDPTPSGLRSGDSLEPGLRRHPQVPPATSAGRDEAEDDADEADLWSILNQDLAKLDAKEPPPDTTLHHALANTSNGIGGQGLPSVADPPHPALSSSPTSNLVHTQPVVVPLFPESDSSEPSPLPLNSASGSVAPTIEVVATHATVANGLITAQAPSPTDPETNISSDDSDAKTVAINGNSAIAAQSGDTSAVPTSVSPSSPGQPLPPLAGLPNDWMEQDWATDAQALAVLKDIQAELHRHPPNPEALALIYQQLGNLYRDRIDQGDPSTESLNIALQAYEQGLNWSDRAALSCPDLLNDLANLYWLRSRRITDTEQTRANLQRSIDLYQRALTQISLEQNPTIFAMVQHNLGTAFGDLAQHQNPVENLQSAIYCYERALSHRSPEADPLRYAATQNNLGTAYWKLSQHHHPTVYLQQAIAAYAEALRYSKVEDNPLHYAMIQNNLGTAHWQLAQQGDAAEHLEAAIAAYEDALQYRTLDTNAAAHASTQNNLGAAYRQLAQHYTKWPDELAVRLEHAIAAYQQAIQAAQVMQHQQPHVPLNFDLGSTYNGLGLAHRQLAIAVPTLSSDAKAHHLTEALQQHLQALEHWSYNPELHQAVVGYIAQTIRATYQECGLPGQNAALSQIPGHLIPEILARL